MKTDSKKSNVVKLVNPSSLTKLTLKIYLEYIGPYSKKYRERDTAYHSYKDIELYFYGEDKNWFESLHISDIKDKLGEIVTDRFKIALCNHLDEYSKLYNYDELISNFVTYHSSRKASNLSINSGIISVTVRYKYCYPDIFVEEDDVISKLLYNFIRGIRNNECDLLDIHEFTEWFNKYKK